MSSHRLCKECGELKPAERFLSANTARPYVCRECWAWEMKRYRDANPEVRHRGRQQTRAYNLSLRELRDRHREEFDEIYE